MANRKNNISDNEVKNASGGYVYPSTNSETGQVDQVVADDQDSHTIKTFSGDNDGARAMAALYDEAYHEGKRVGMAQGLDRGFRQGQDFSRQK